MSRCSNRSASSTSEATASSSASMVRAAMAALATDYQPLTDLRASASYRRRVAAQLLMRLWLETRPEQPLSAAETTVWQPLGARA